jgi:hypothetical protein
MSDRAAWLEQRCPEYQAPPSALCRRWRCGPGTRGQAVPAAHLHVAPGRLERPCPTCKAPPGERCLTPTGREASRIHAARLRPPRWQLVWRPAGWEELERRGATVVVVPLRGHAGQGGRTDTIKLLRVEDELAVEVERWTERDQLCHALEALVWDRFGSFAGQPPVRSELVWSTGDRRVVICGKRGDSPFEELAA